LRRRSRRGLNRIGVLAMALLLALGAMGTAYGAWSDEIYIQSTITTGSTSYALSCGTAHSPEVSCGASNATLHITVAATAAAPTPAGSYNHSFKVLNTGDLPVKVQKINVSSLPSGVHVSTTGVVESSVIDPGLAPIGYVIIDLDDDIEESFNFDVAFNIVLWNE